MEELRKTVKNHRLLQTKYREYFDKFSVTVGSYYDEKIKKIDELINEYDKLSAKNISNTDKPEQLFQSMSVVNTLQALSEQITELFISMNPRSHKFTQEFSTTYVLNTADMFDKLMVFLRNINNKNDKFLVEIINSFGDILIKQKGEDNLNFFETIRKHYKKYPSISLYAFVVQKILDESEGATSHKIMEYIEEDKNEELSNPFKLGKSPKLEDPPILTFGFLPKTSYMELGDLVKKVFDKSISGKVKESDLDKLGKVEKTTIIIQFKSTNVKVEYHMDKLLQRSDISNSSGIDKNIIDKLVTIETGDSKYVFDIKKMGDLKSDKVLILESQDRKTYRVMSPWGNRLFIVNKFAVKNYLDYVNGKFSRRAENYNRIMINKMKNNMFLQRSVDTKGLSQEAQLNEIKFLRNAIYLALNKFYTETMDKKKIKSNKDLVEMLNDPKIVDIFNRELLKNYYEFLKKNDLVGDDNFVFTEVVSTFLGDLQFIQRGFTREIYNNSEKLKPNTELYKKDDVYVYSELKTITDAVIKNTLEKIMSNDSNIYQSLIYKTMLISI